MQRNDDIRKYIVNVSDYNKEVEIISDYVKNSSNNIKIIDLESESQNKEIIKITSYIDNLKKVNFIVIIVFFLVIFVVNKNVVEDQSFNIELEKRLGFRPYQIKLNIFKRLCSLHVLNVIILILGLIITHNLWLFIFPLFIVLLIVLAIYLRKEVR